MSNFSTDAGLTGFMIWGWKICWTVLRRTGI